MSRKWMIVGVGLTAAVLLMALVVPALAQTATPTAPTTKGLGGWGFGRGGCFGVGSWDTFDAAAKALGMTPVELFTALHSGKTLEEVATEKGVDIQKVQDAMQEVQVAAAKAQIEQAVTDGKLTREQADWLLKGMDLGMPMGRFGGRGFGHGGQGTRSSDEATPAPTSVTPARWSF